MSVWNSEEGERGKYCLDLNIVMKDACNLRRLFYNTTYELHASCYSASLLSILVVLEALLVFGQSSGTDSPPFLNRHVLVPRLIWEWAS